MSPDAPEGALGSRHLRGHEINKRGQVSRRESHVHACTQPSENRDARARVSCTSAGAHRVPADERSPGGGGRDSYRRRSGCIGAFDPRGLDAGSADIGIGLEKQRQE